MKILIVATLVLHATKALLGSAQTTEATPAKIANAVQEGDLTTVTLTPQAVQRLGIAIVLAELKKVPHTQLYGGEVVLPLDSGLAATTNYSRAAPPSPFVPNPPASPMEALKLVELQMVADAEVEKSQAQLELARIAAGRAEKLLRAETGSQRMFDEAQATLKVAQAGLEISRNRRALLGVAVGDARTLDRLWVRVPIYVGDLPLLDAAKDARVGGVAARANSPSRLAQLVAGPATANATAATVDWYFTVDNQDRGLSLGQRVGVTLSLRGEEKSLVVPWAGVLHDINGGQWVYENTVPQTFVRRRVQVVRVVGADALVKGSLQAGAKIVAAGAAELFGTEFGAGK